MQVRLFTAKGNSSLQKTFQRKPHTIFASVPYHCFFDNHNNHHHHHHHNSDINLSRFFSSPPPSTSSSTPSPSSRISSTSIPKMPLAEQSVQDFCTALASKQPTPGGGASAAIGAAVGAAAASMSAMYTQRKKDEESGAAEQARQLIATMDIGPLLSMADDDEQAYQDLQSTWKKDCTLSEEEISSIQARALQVPTVLLEACHARIVAIKEFLPHCNPNITSDAKVGIHQLAGAARAAYQTVLVNSPPKEEKDRLVKLLLEIQQIENELLQLE